MIGLIDVAEWLLGHGAHKSLHIRNTMGATPLDVARIFGPYPAIEAMLGAAMLNRQFDTQFAIRRGSLLRKQAGGAIDPEVDDDSPSDENRAPEPTPVETIADSKSVSSGNEGNASWRWFQPNHPRQWKRLRIVARARAAGSTARRRVR